jgi:hypothetical protein
MPHDDEIPIRRSIDMRPVSIAFTPPEIEFEFAQTPAQRALMEQIEPRKLRDAELQFKRQLEGRAVTVREWFREMRGAFIDSLVDALHEERYFAGSRADVIRQRSYLRSLEVALELLRVDDPALPHAIALVVQLMPR